MEYLQVMNLKEKTHLLPANCLKSGKKPSMCGMGGVGDMGQPSRPLMYGPGFCFLFGDALRARLQGVAW